MKDFYSRLGRRGEGQVVLKEFICGNTFDSQRNLQDRLPVQRHDRPLEKMAKETRPARKKTRPDIC
jgi:hypothetical protein